MLINYIVAFVLLVLFFGIYSLLLYFENKKLKRYFEDEKEKIDIYREFIKICEQTRAKWDTLERTPWMRTYLFQAENIVFNNPFDVSCIEVTPLLNNKALELEVFDANEFAKEYWSTTQNNRELVQSCSNALERIYRRKHPVKWRIRQIKKNMDERKLSYFERSRRINEKRAIEKKEKHKQATENYSLEGVFVPEGALT